MASEVHLVNDQKLEDSREPKKFAADAERYRKLGQFLRVDDEIISHINTDHIVSIVEIEDA